MNKENPSIDISSSIRHVIRISLREMCAALYAESTVNAAVKMETMFRRYASSPMSRGKSVHELRHVVEFLNCRPYLQNAQFLFCVAGGHFCLCWIV